MKPAMPLRVTTPLTRHELEETFGVGFRGAAPGTIRGVALDGRTLEPGDAFFALRGARDGHDFVDQAYAKGAALCVVERPLDDARPHVVVPDAYRALANLARRRRERWAGTVVAVSGSNGKTTTKEMIRGLLGARGPVFASPGNWNNWLGVPLCLLSLQDEERVAVLEMGMSAAGEIEDYCRIALPNVAVLTNVGYAHVGELGSIEAVADAKAELFRGLAADGTAVVLIDDARVLGRSAYLAVRQIRVSARREADVWVEPSRIHYGDEEILPATPFVGEHMLSNLACALGVAFALGVPAADVPAGLAAIRLPKMRLTEHALRSGAVVIDDSYNANPDSLRAALAHVQGKFPGRKIAVLGDMRELGSFSRDLHRESGRSLPAYGFDRLYCTGEESRAYVEGANEGGMIPGRARHFDSKADLIAALAGEIVRGDAVLVKGSRGSRMEEVVSGLLRENEKEKRA